MKNFRDCISRAVGAGEMSRERAEQVLREYDDVLPALQRHMGRTQAEVEAARIVVQRAKKAAFERRRVMQLQAAAIQPRLRAMAEYRNAFGKFRPGDYLKDMIENRFGGGMQTLVSKMDVVTRSFKQDLTDAYSRFKVNIVGIRKNRSSLVDVVRELFGESTGNAEAKALAKAWSEVAERARTRFNSAGGHIGKLDDWGLPQSHNARLVARSTYEQWRDYIVPRLDVRAMAERWNDGLEFSEQELELILRDAYDAIVTDGLSRRKPQVNFGSALRNRRADHRFFKFKSADDWIAYNERFGSGRDIFDAMDRHLETMGADIALMEELGPNPTHTFQYLSDAAKVMAARSGDAKLLERTRADVKFAAEMFDAVRGVTNIPVSGRAARAGNAVRAWNVAAMLGSAVFSSITDFNTQRVTAAAAGMASLKPIGMIGKLARRMSREEAHEAGLIFDNAVRVGNAKARLELEDYASDLANRAGDAVIRASGLGWLTEIQRQAFGLSFMNEVATRWRGKAFADLPDKTQQMFEGFGINAMDWEAIRKVPVHEMSNGLKIVRNKEIAETVGQGLADRYLSAIVTMTERAVPTASVRGRANVMFGTRPGTVIGELARFGFQFKSFPLTIMLDNVSIIAKEASSGRKATALSMASNIVIGNTILGAIALQMKEVSKGRDPQDMTTSKFWGRALMQGGGLGIFGDFFFSSTNRFGGSLGETLAGPGVGLASDVIGLTVGNVKEGLAGDDMNLGRDMVGFLRRYTPGGSLWYLRLAYEREVLDQIQQVVDPRAYNSFRARMRGARKFDTEFWLPPGSSLVRGEGRMPDMKNVLGQ